MNGAYYIIGGFKGGKKAGRIIPTIVDCFCDSAKMLYLGAAHGNNFIYEENCRSAFMRSYPRGVFKTLNLCPKKSDNNFDDNNLSKIEDAFAQSDIIFFDGGNVGVLNKVFKDYELKDVCETAVYNGKMVGGICAGGSVLANTVIHYEGIEAERSHGVGLIASSAISCEINSLKKECGRSKLLLQSFREDGEVAFGVGLNQVAIFPMWEEVYALQWSEQESLSFRIDCDEHTKPLPARKVPA